jgi:hypothetical protein
VINDPVPRLFEAAAASEHGVKREVLRAAVKRRSPGARMSRVTVVLNCCKVCASANAQGPVMGPRRRKDRRARGISLRRAVYAGM